MTGRPADYSHEGITSGGSHMICSRDPARDFQDNDGGTPREWGETTRPLASPRGVEGRRQGLQAFSPFAGVYTVVILPPPPPPSRSQSQHHSHSIFSGYVHRSLLVGGSDGNGHHDRRRDHLDRPAKDSRPERGAHRTSAPSQNWRRPATRS